MAEIRCVQPTPAYLTGLRKVLDNDSPRLVKRREGQPTGG